MLTSYADSTLMSHAVSTLFSDTVLTLPSLLATTHPSSQGTALSVLEIDNVLSVLPVMAMAILCVWAAHITVVSPEVVAFTAEPPKVVAPTLLPESDLKSSPERTPNPEFGPERISVLDQSLDQVLSPKILPKLIQAPEQSLSLFQFCLRWHPLQNLQRWRFRFS